MKSKRMIILLLLILPTCFCLTSCSPASTVYITNVEKTGTNGLVDYYKFYRSDGTSFIMQIENGKDGTDGSDSPALNLNAIKEYCEENDLNLEDYISNIIHANSLQNATNKALKSSVTIVTDTNVGSGVIYRIDNTYSYIITNYHVVYNSHSTNKISKNISVFQYGESGNMARINTDVNLNGKVEASYIGGSLVYDLAVLRVLTSDLLQNNSDTCAVEFADNYSLAENCIAIGNPDGQGISVVSGIVSVESEYLEMTAADDTTKVTFRVIRHTAPVNNGNSGGGLFNEFGKLIGIVNAKIIQDSIEGWCYALPCDNVKIVTDSLIKDCIVNQNGTIIVPSQLKRLSLGISYQPYGNSWCDYDNTNNTQTIHGDFKIDEVDSGKFADKLNLQIGDIIKSLTITSLENSATSTYDIDKVFKLEDYLLTIKKGDIIKMNILRNGQSITTSSITVLESDIITIE